MNHSQEKMLKALKELVLDRIDRHIGDADFITPDLEYAPDLGEVMSEIDDICRQLRSIESTLRSIQDDPPDLRDSMEEFNSSIEVELDDFVHKISQNLYETINDIDLSDLNLDLNDFDCSKAQIVSAEQSEITLKIDPDSDKPLIKIKLTDERASFSIIREESGSVVSFENYFY